jgi:two-component system, OmpR family, sensor kinase
VAVAPDSEQTLLALLQQLIDLPALDPRQTLTDGASAVATWLGCDKVDVFLFDASRGSLAAIGTSQTPLGALQHKLGLDVMPLAQGGRSVEVYVTGNSHLDGHVEQDSEELRGIVRDLAVRSQATVAVQIAGKRRGVLSVVSQRPEQFGPEDLRVLELVTKWIGSVAHRAELVHELREEERQRGRRMAADDIVTVLAHDMWNHLNPLSARLQLLRLRASSGDTIEPAQLDPAVLGVQRLARLTQDLLDSARLEQGLFELELEPVDLSQLVRDVAELCATPGVAVQVEAPPGLTAIADSGRLRQALENVISNGIRYSAAGAPLRISVEPEPASRGVRIRIKDTGPGIRPELLPHLFERFVSEGATRGLGLGLYLAQRVAAAHGGKLEVESRLGVGSTFTLSLPLEGPGAAAR